MQSFLQSALALLDVSRRSEATGLRFAAQVSHPSRTETGAPGLPLR